MNLFNDPDLMTASSRATDPDSSMAAAAEIEDTGSASDQRHLIAEIIRECPGLTAGEIAARSGMTNVQVSRRCPEIKRAGLIRRGDQRECTIKGRLMLTWWAEVVK